MKFLNGLKSWFMHRLERVIASLAVRNTEVEVTIKVPKEFWENFEYLRKQVGSPDQEHLIQEALAFFTHCAVRNKRGESIGVFGLSGERQFDLSTPLLDKAAGLDTPKEVVYALSSNPYVFHAGVMYISSKYLPYEPPKELI